MSEATKLSCWVLVLPERCWGGGVWKGTWDPPAKLPVLAFDPQGVTSSPCLPAHLLGPGKCLLGPPLPAAWEGREGAEAPPKSLSLTSLPEGSQQLWRRVMRGALCLWVLVTLGL